VPLWRVASREGDMITYATLTQIANTWLTECWMRAAPETGRQRSSYPRESVLETRYPKLRVLILKPFQSEQSEPTA
jgi:hypothetical protein